MDCIGELLTKPRPAQEAHQLLELLLAQLPVGGLGWGAAAAACTGRCA